MLENLAALALVSSLAFYVLMGGADFGGGVWDLLARGERAAAHRKLIARAIGPIWEANHVWLILAVVILFTAFPEAYATIVTALHVPLSLMLLGIVFRGAAFTFRAYDSEEDKTQRLWGRAFAIASVVTPVLLGMSVGAIMSGRIVVVEGAVTSGYVASWLAPFPIATGLLCLTIFTYLAAVYLAVEAEEREVQEDFRKRAIVAGAVVLVALAVVFVLSFSGAPQLAQARRERALLAFPPPLLAIAFAAAALVFLARKRVFLARLLAAAEVVSLVVTWGIGQYPYLVVPAHTIADSAAPSATLRLLAGALALGAVVLFPSLAYLMKVFKGRKAFAVLDDYRRKTGRLKPPPDLGS
ncbi:cytochrome d ubiquinol oxidase subunit II [bacterium]|nr:cytochrome d ubiquinol oxidase subunit II [bacterium]